MQFFFNFRVRCASRFNLLRSFSQHRLHLRERLRKRLQSTRQLILLGVQTCLSVRRLSELILNLLAAFFERL